MVTTTQSASDLELRALAGSKVTVPTNDVTIEQDLTVNGSTFLKATDIVGTLNQTGDVTQSGNVTQTGDYTITGNATISGVSQFQDININQNVVTTTLPNSDLTLTAQGTGKVIIPSNDVNLGQNLTVVGTTTTTNLVTTGTITSPTFTTGNIEIFDNVVRTTVSNSDLELRANSTGVVYVPSNNVVVSQNLTINGSSSLKNTSIVGTVTQTGNTIQTGNVTQTGNTIQSGNFTLTGTAQLKEIKIQDNFITTTSSNADLELLAHGTGRVLIPNNNVVLNKDLTVVGTTNTSTINSTGTVTSATFSTGNIRINGNAIETTVSNSDLELRANGSGGIAIEQVTVNENVISSNTNTDIVVQPNGTGIVDVNSTQSLRVPRGTTAQRPSPAAAGMIRYNTDYNGYEGYNGTDWIRLDGIWDVDRNTYITPELTPGANDNTIRFVTNGTQVADLNSTRFAVNNINAGDINIQNDTIMTITANADLSLVPNGTGSVATGNFKLKGSSITNTVADSVTRFVQYGTGYFKIAGTTGFVIPVGTSTERPAITEAGMIRFNTIDGRVEVFDGNIWASTAGSSSGVTYNDALDLSIVNALIFG